MEGSLTQKWGNKKAGYWLTQRKSLDTLGRGAASRYSEWNGPDDTFVKEVSGRNCGKEASRVGDTWR